MQPVVAPHRRSVSLADTATREQAEVSGGAPACGHVCDDGCHGCVVCVRAQHPHDPGNVSPHLGFGPDGNLLQWTCLPGDHDGLTADARQAMRQADAAAARVAATRALLDQIDPALLVSLLREGGHL